MTLLIGTDEAGYGPNLGPLVVAASAWHIEGDGTALAGQLARATAAVAAAAGWPGPLWGDSKRLYQPGAGVGALESGVLATFAECPTTGGDLATRLGAGSDPDAPTEWPRFQASRLPVAADAAAVARLAAAVAAVLPSHGLRLAALRCRIVHPATFNALLAGGLNKSDILSRTTLDLAALLRAAAPDEPAEIWCDRHGGRKTYAALVGRHFAAPLVRTIAETADSSRYEIPADRSRIEFAVGGEARIPVALASMTAKYVRELAMGAFNAHWSARQPGLAPTAGYPVDARRWWNEAHATVQRAGLDAAAIWRRA